MCPLSGKPDLTWVECLKPSTLAGMVADLGWAIEDRTLSPSQYAWMVRVCLNELVKNQGVERAREMIAQEAP